MKLSALKPGESLLVKKISTPDLQIKHRLNDLGITRGITLKLVGFAPLGDPVKIELRGYELAIEKLLASYVEGDKL